MKSSKIWQVYLAFIMLILGVFLITGCSSSSSNDAAAGGGSLPTVTAVVPVNHAGSIATNSKIAVTFSKDMNHATIIAAGTFTVTTGGTPVAGTVTHLGQNATFAPTGLGGTFAPNSIFTATITTAAKDTAGNPLAINFVWSFTTRATTDTTAPIVTLTVPVSGAGSVARNTKIAATFSKAMDPSTITGTTFTVTGPGSTPVAGTVNQIGLNATFTPTSNLAASTVYTVTITTGAMDLAGNALAAGLVPNPWSFTTGTATDTTAPTVTSTNPVDGAIDVALNKSIKATFSKAMDPLTITTTTFTLKEGLTPVLGTVTYVGLVATFKPTSELALDTIYTVTITTGAKDLAGNAQAGGGATNPWNFTTITTLAAGRLPVDLGTAENFVILSKTGITEATPASTTINGNIGTSPITGAAITVACSEMATGDVYTVDAAGPACRVVDPVGMTTAVSDMETAYTDAAGRTLPDFTELYAGDLSGRTLVPGLYKWSTDVVINAGDVTLSGGANDVWIFQIAGDLTTGGGSVVLGGSAQPKNIFWQVGGVTGATIASGDAFNGIILSAKQVVVVSGASLTGRALAQTQVTLDGNTITAP
jgi:hypothetical protein